MAAKQQLLKIEIVCMLLNVLVDDSLKKLKMKKCPS